MKEVQNGPDAVDAGTLAKLFDCSETTIRNYADEGLVVRVSKGRYDKDASTTALVRHLRDTAAGRGGVAEVLNLTAERARLSKEQADAHELKNGLLRGELVRAEEVERTWADHIRKARSAILAVPSRIRQLLGHIGDMETRVIDRELREALTALGEDPDEEQAA